MITKQMNTFFHRLFELYQLVYFIFAFQDLQNSTSRVPHLLYVLVCKIHINLTFMFYFRFDTFSSNSGSGLTSQQLKKFLISETDEGKLTLKNKDMLMKIYATAKFVISIIIIAIIIMVVSYIVKITEAGNSEPFWVTPSTCG